MRNFYVLLMLFFCGTTIFAQVPTFNPTDGATGVPVSPTLTMSFSGYSSLSLATNSNVIVRNVTTSTSEIILSTGNGLDPADSRLQISGNTLTIDLSGDFLTSGNDYAIYVPDNTITVDSSPYNELDNLTTWNFTIVSGVSDPTFSPTDNATGVSLSPTLSMTFDSYSSVSLTLNRNILVRNITTSTTEFSLSTGNGLDPMDSRINISGNVITIDLTGETLNASTDYAIYTTDGTINVDGEYYNELDDVTKWNFTTSDLTVSDPTFSPLDDATGVSTSPSLSMTFDSYTNASLNAYGNILIRNVTTSTTEHSLSTGDGLDPMDSRISISGNVITINLTGETLVSNNEYAVYIPDGIVVVDGLAYDELDNITKWSFTTVNLTVTEPTFSPLDEATDVPLSPTLSMTFDAHSNVSLNTNNNILVRNVTTSTTEFSLTTGNGLDPMDARLNISGNTLTIDFTGETLNPNNDYAIYIPDGTILVDGLAYDELQNLTKWNFTTTTSITDPTFSPVDNALGVSINPILTATFAEGTTVSLQNGQIVVIRDKTSGSNIHSFTIGTDSEVSTNNNVLTIDLTDSQNILTEETEYAIYIIDDVISVDGQYYNQLENYDNWTFTTDKFYTWTGGSDTNFESTGNWSGADAYSDGFSVIIPHIVSGNLPKINNGSTVNIKNMIINAGGSLEIESGGSLSITNSIRLESSVDPNVGNASFLIGGTLNTTGADINVEQIVEGQDKVMYISSPVSGATQDNSNINDGLYKRNTSSWSIVSSSEVLEAGIGYAAYGFANDKISFSGDFNNSEVNLTSLLRTTSPNNYGWNLIGNPFPCSIDWEQVITTNMDDEFYILNNDISVYGVYNGSGGEPLYVNVNTNNPSHIPSCHSFWVQVSQGQTNGSITIPLSARTTSTYTYLKNATVSQNEKIRFVGIGENNTKNELLISFNPEANDEDDSMDSEIRMSSNSSLLQLYTIHSDKKYIIDSYHDYEDGKLINLGYKVGKAGTFKISLSELANIEGKADIKLEDLVTGQTHEITLGDEYSFTSESGTFNSRFMVHILPPVTTSIEKKNNSDNSLAAKIYAINKTLYIKIPELSKPRYQIYSVSGRQISSGNLNSGTTNEVSVEEGGLLIVKIISDEKSVAQKVYLKK